MLRNVLAIVLFGLSLVAAKADVKADLQAKYDELSASFAKGDSTLYEKTLASDYVLSVPGRKDRTRDSILVDFKKQMAMMRDSHWLRKILDVKAKGNTVVVRVHGHYTGTFGPPNESHHFVNDADSEDTWSKGPAGWQLHKSELIKLSATVDGKPAGRV